MEEKRLDCATCSQIADKYLKYKEDEKIIIPFCSRCVNQEFYNKDLFDVITIDGEEIETTQNRRKYKHGKCKNISKETSDN